MRSGQPCARPLLVAVFAAVCAVSTPLAAQEETIALKAYAEVGLVRVAFSPNKNEGLDLGIRTAKPAFGLDMAIVFTAQPPLEFAAGIQYTSHTTTDTTGKFGALHFYVEPRLTLKQSGRLIPYVSAHLGYMRTKQDIVLFDNQNAAVTGSAVQTGPVLGAGAGVLYKASAHVRIYAAGNFERISLGNIDFDGAPVGSTKGKGTAIAIRVGASLDFSLNQSPLKTIPRR